MSNTVSSTAGYPRPMASHPDPQHDYGRRVARWLDMAAQRLPNDIEHRLNFAREQAVRAARHARAAQPARGLQVAVSGWHASGTAAGMRGGPAWWTGWASLAPALLLAVGLVAIDHLHQQHRVMAAVDVDSALLADGLPPAAYSDPGFAEFVRQSPP